MTTRVPIRYGGTGANTAATARTALGAAPLAAYDQANSAYAQANLAYDAANNAQVTIYSNNSSNVTTQNVNFVNTATVTVTVTADGSNANIAFTAAPQTVVNDTYTAAGNTAAAATANIANGLYAIATNAYGQANAAYSAANNSNLLSGGLITGTLNVTQDLIVGGNIYLEGNTTFINVTTYSVQDPLIYLASNNDLTDSVDIGFMGGKNTSGTYSHTGLARDATDGKWKLFDNLADEGHIGNVVDFANTTVATLVANVEANSILLSGNAVATNVQVNTVYAQANAAYAQANLAYDAANNAQVTIYANNASNVTTQNINFVNTSSIAVTVTADGSNANIAFSSLGGGVVNTVIKTVTYSATNADANLTYNLPISPAGVPYIFVIKNGITLTPNTDYSLAGNTLTVIESGSANDTIEVRYFDSVNVFTPPDTTILVDSNVVSSQTNTFYISQNVTSINSLTVSKNGLVLTPNLHFSVTNNIVTLNTAAEINDTMLFVHLYTFGNVYSDVILKTGGTMTGNLNVAATLITQNVVPNLNVTYDLGTSTKRFKDLWLSNSTIYLGNTSISANGDKLVVPDLELASGANLSNAVLKTGDTMTGNLNVAATLIVGNATISTNGNILGLTGVNGYIDASIDGALTAAGEIVSQSYIESTSTIIGYSGININEYTGLFWRDLPNGNYFGGINYDQSNGLRIYTGGASPGNVRMTIANTGNVLVDSGTLFVDAVGNRVGIANSNPNTGYYGSSLKLQVGTTPNNDYTIAAIEAGTQPSLYLRHPIGYAEFYNSYGDIGLNAYLNGEGKSLNTDIFSFGGYNNTASAYLSFFSNKLYITGNGNVGIGTTDPTANLHVTGTIKDTPILSVTSSGTYSDNAAGRVIFANTTSAITITAAAAATAGFSYTVIRGNTGNVTIANSGVTRLNSASITTMNVNQYGAVTVVYTATNQVIVFGDFV